MFQASKRWNSNFHLVLFLSFAILLVIIIIYMIKMIINMQVLLCLEMFEIMGLSSSLLRWVWIKKHMNLRFLYTCDFLYKSWIYDVLTILNQFKMI